VSIFALNVATGLGLGLGIDASLFMVSRFREALHAGETVDAAVGTTLRTAGHTVLFSSLTVMAACAALTLFPENFLFSVGAVGVIVSALTAVSTLVVLPAVLRLLGEGVNSLAPRSWQAPPAARAGFWYRLAQLVMRRPARVAIATSGLLVALGLPALGLHLGFADTTALPAAAGARRVDVLLQSGFPPAASAPILVLVNAPGARSADLGPVQARLAALDGVVAVGPARPVAAGLWILSVATGQPASGDRSIKVVNEIRSLSQPPAIEVTGQTATFLDLRAGVLARLPLAAAVAAASTITLLFLMTGSVLLPVKAVLMNLLTLSATLGVLVLVFQDGRLQDVLGYASQGNLEQTTLIVVIAFVFGLSTDYGCFLLGRIKEAHDQGLSDAEAVALGLERTGRIVTAAAALFAVAIGAFVISQILYTKELAVGTCVGVFIDASIVRALLVPSLMALLGRWNWWAPPSLRRHRYL
jgi:RND superfamily putative drug exporter